MVIYGKTLEINENTENTNQAVYDLYETKRETLAFNEGGNKYGYENLFNPETGLWAETKQNTQFRESTSKWRTVIGTGFIGLLGKHLWDMFTK